MPVGEVKSGQTASFALKKIKRSQIRKGMVMVSPKVNPVACWEFNADIMVSQSKATNAYSIFISKSVPMQIFVIFQVLHHPTTIAVRYQAMVHCGPIRQTASILKMDADCLRTGDKANVHFK